MSKKYRRDALAAIHETMEALHDVGAIDKQTMRRFDDARLTPIRLLKPEEIKACPASTISLGGSQRNI
jgi:putative transcriptional regulator